MRVAEDASDFVPGVGDAIGVDDTKTAFNEGRYLDAVINGVTTAIGAVPGGGDVVAGLSKAIFGGLGAVAKAPWNKMKDTPDFKNAEMVDEDLTEDILNGVNYKGQKRETDLAIWRETGWFRGSDGEWRFEIPDDKAILNENVYKNQRFLKGEEVPLDHILKHDQLYEAYPDLLNVGVRVNSKLEFGKGSFDFRTGLIEISGVPDKETLIHEIQHAVQEIEGFSRGASRNADQIKPGHPAYELFEEGMKVHTPMSKKDWKKVYKEEVEAGKAIGFKPGYLGNSYEDYLDRWNKGFAKNKDKLEGFARQNAADEFYRRSAGENDAEAAAKRMDYDPMDRYVNKFPLDDHKVKPEDQIRDFRGRGFAKK